MREQLVSMLRELEKTNDVFFYEDGEDIEFDFNDWDGFDEDYNEIDREYINKELVSKVENFLEMNCKEQLGDLYKEYLFDTFSVTVGYSSFDI